jgi:hypothetical protein
MRWGDRDRRGKAGQRPGTERRPPGDRGNGRESERASRAADRTSGQSFRQIGGALGVGASTVRENLGRVQEARKHLRRRRRTALMSRVRGQWQRFSLYVFGWSASTSLAAHLLYLCAKGGYTAVTAHRCETRIRSRTATRCSSDRQPREGPVVLFHGHAWHTSWFVSAEVMKNASR